MVTYNGDMMQQRLKLWRVRVLRQREDWVDVESPDKIHAEIEAGKLPGVVNVFPAQLSWLRPSCSISPLSKIEIIVFLKHNYLFWFS